MARTATTRFTVALATAALLAGCAVGEGPQRNSAGKITQAGDALLLDLQNGDCIANLRARLLHPDGGHNGVPTVTGVKCSDKHDAEIVKVARVEGVAGDDWPGFQIVDGEAAHGRLQLAVRLARAKKAGGSVKVVSFRPTRERWNFEGQRQIFYMVMFAKPQRKAAPK